MNRIFGYILNMFPYMLIAIPVVILIRVISCSFLKKKEHKTTVWHELGVCLFFLFLVGLFSQTIIPQFDFGVGGISITNGNLLGEINLIPGKVFIDTWRESMVGGYWLYFAINFIGNICLFVPIGFCVPLLWNKSTLPKTLLVGFLISLFIELCQLPQARGTDIDDLWINTLGAMIGYLLYVGVCRIAKQFFLKFRIQKKGESN